MLTARWAVNTHLTPQTPILTVDSVDPTVWTPTASQWSTLQSDIAAVVADIRANPTPSCNPRLIGVDSSLAVVITIPALGGDFFIRNAMGDACEYNGATNHAAKVLADYRSLGLPY